MNIRTDLKLRLQFISRVAEKECRYLNRTTKRLFTEEFTLAKAQQLDTNDDLSEQLEAFVSRFSRLQDTLGDKFISQLLIALGEKQATFIDDLDKAERLGWITSVDEWQAMRYLRNQMVHEYIENMTVLTSSIQTARNFVVILTTVHDALQNELQQRGWLDD